MKKNLFVFAMLMMSVMAFAKDVKTVVFTTQSQMHCSSCEDKIKSNLRFEKGISVVDNAAPADTAKAKKSCCCGKKADAAAAGGCCGKKAEGAAAGGCCSKKADVAASGEKKSCCCSKKAEEKK